MGAPGVPQLVGATCGIQLAPPVSFFSLCGSLEEIRHQTKLKLCPNAEVFFDNPNRIKTAAVTFIAVSVCSFDLTNIQEMCKF